MLAQLLLGFAVVAACVLLTDREAAAQTPRPQNDLFYNYYYPNCPGAVAAGGGVPVQMYPCPLPVPQRVGHTYITYQPLLPHEFMYPHSRTYHRYKYPYSRIPSNTTRVTYW